LNATRKLRLQAVLVCLFTCLTIAGLFAQDAPVPMPKYVVSRVVLPALVLRPFYMYAPYILVQEGQVFDEPSLRQALASSVAMLRVANVVRSVETSFQQATQADDPTATTTWVVQIDLVEKPEGLRYGFGKYYLSFRHLDDLWVGSRWRASIGTNLQALSLGWIRPAGVPIEPGISVTHLAVPEWPPIPEISRFDYRLGNAFLLDGWNRLYLGGFAVHDQQWSSGWNAATAGMTASFLLSNEYRKVLPDSLWGALSGGLDVFLAGYDPGNLRWWLSGQSAWMFSSYTELQIEASYASSLQHNRFVGYNSPYAGLLPGSWSRRLQGEIGLRFDLPRITGILNTLVSIVPKFAVATWLDRNDVFTDWYYAPGLAIQGRIGAFNDAGGEITMYYDVRGNRLLFTMSNF